MKRKLVVAVVLCVVLLASMAMLAAPAALAKVSVVRYTALEAFAAPPNITSVTPCGSFLKVTMANTLTDYDASHPWGNTTVHTNSTSLVRTDDAVWTDARFVGSYWTEAPSGRTEGWFSGSMSWATFAMDYRFIGRGVSGEVSGTLWTGTVHSPGYGAPAQMNVRVLIP